MKDFFKGIIKWAIVGSFFVPLLVFPVQFIFPFIVPKILIFRSLSLIMFGAFVLLFLTNPATYAPRRSWLHMAVLFFLASYVVSTFIGVDWYRSFWDNHERMLGLFTIVHYIFYYLVLATVIRTDEEWKWLLRIFLFAGGIVLVIGFLQKYIDPQIMLNRGAKRVSSTLGNAIYFSAYGMFLFFIGLLQGVKEKQLSWKIYSGIVGIAGFFAIFWGGTRGTFIGVVAALGVLCLLYFFSLKGKPEFKTLRYACIGSILAGIALLGVMFAMRQTAFVKGLPVIGRLVQLDISSGSAGTRVMAWGVALEGWQVNPVFGWGPNNFYYAFNQFYRPEFLRHGWGETWFDNAHSVFMNTLATRGFIGILSYLGLFVAAFISLQQAYKRDALDMHMRNISMAFLVGHFVHNIFVFENPTSYLYFFFFLAMTASVTRQDVLSEGVPKDKRLPGAAVVGIFSFVLLFIFVTNVNPARANMRTLVAIRAFHSGLDAVAAYDYAKAVPSPHIDDIRNDVARTIRELVPQYVQAGRTEQLGSFLQLAYDELGENMRIHPKDIRIHLQRAGIAEVIGQLNQDVQFMLQSESMLEEALRLSPKRQQLQYQLANTKAQLGKMNEAVALLQTSIDNDPTIDEGWWRLAGLLQETGNHEAALETLALAEERGIVFKGQGLSVVERVLGNE